jgi:hypothetical protein
MTPLVMWTTLLCGALQEDAGLQAPPPKDRIRFSAFADVTLGIDGGGKADPKDAALFESFGAESFPLNSYGRGFGVVGTDFVVTANLTENLVYQGEVNLQASRGEDTELELDFERFYLDYRHSEYLNAQVGFFFTPIGYHNRFLYSRAWLMHSVQIPDLFEEELNLVPTHSVGANLHGRFPLFGQNFKYVVGLANGRAMTPTQNVFARDQLGKEVTGLLEWEVPGVEDFFIGISGWTDVIRTRKVVGLGTTVTIDTAEKARLRETGLDAYVTYYGRAFNLLFEFVWSQQTDEIGNLDSKRYIMHGFTGEISFNLAENTVHPYIRWDYTNLPSHDQGPYYGLRRDGDTLTKYYVPEFNGIMLGVNYDATANMRIKLEYAHNFDGPRGANSVVLQVAYGF